MDTNKFFDPQDHGRFIGWIIVLAIASLACLVIAFIGVAMAHKAPTGWSYPLSCCSNIDCREAKDREVRETADGYVLTSTGEAVAYSDRRVKQSPDGRFHVCQQGGDFDHGRILCLFAPPRGF